MRKRLTFLDNGKPAYRFDGCVYSNEIADRLFAYEQKDETLCSNFDEDRFKDFLTQRNEAVCQAAFDLLAVVSRGNRVQPDDNPLEWDMSLIGPVADAAERVLREHGYPVCYPYLDDNERACYMGSECSKLHCPLADLAVNK